MATSDLPSEEKAKLLTLRAGEIHELAALQGRLDHPGAFIRHRLSRFVAGFWPAFVIGFLVLRLSFALSRKMQEKGVQRTMSLALGFRAFQVVDRFGATNGLISVLWNRSDGLRNAWLVWPIISGAVLLATVILLEVVREGSTAKPHVQSSTVRLLRNRPTSVCRIDRYRFPVWRYGSAAAFKSFTPPFNFVVNLPQDIPATRTVGNHCKTYESLLAVASRRQTPRLIAGYSEPG